MLALEVLGLRKLIIIVGLNGATGSTVKVVTNVQCKTSLRVAASQTQGLLISVHVLLPISLPLVNQRLVPVLKTVEEVLSITKKGVGLPPSLCAKPTEYPAILILNDHDSGFPFSATLKESDKTAAIFIHVENSFPFTLPVKAGETPYEI